MRGLLTDAGNIWMTRPEPDWPDVEFNTALFDRKSPCHAEQDPA